MNQRLRALSEAGVSIWLDDLSRKRLTSGSLAELIAQDSVVGVTTNPSIFAAALQNSADYAEQVTELGSMPTDEAIKQLCATDVRAACDLFAPLYAATAGEDGRVSIEVQPGLAHDTEATITQAAELHALVDRENVLIKIPATAAGLPAITETIAAGISVNVTLIFSVQRYREVMNAYLAGLERAARAGLDLSKIHSVASLFISRIDSEVDARLHAAGRSELAGRAGVANAIVAYAAHTEVFTDARFATLAALGANPQRPLWASTGTKNPDYSDTLYVSSLVAPGVVNTMPEKTLRAFADHGEVLASIEGQGAAAQAQLDELSAAGIDLAGVFAQLEAEGVDKFVASWAELSQAVQTAQKAAAV